MTYLKAALIALFAFFTIQEAESIVTIHAFGPNNKSQINIEKCDLAKDADTFFKNGQNFMTLYVPATNGKCIRYKKLEEYCEPLLYYCSTSLYKYKSYGIVHFKNCPHPIFKNQSFEIRSSKTEACIDN